MFHHNNHTTGMNTVKATIDKNKIQGTGSNLYIVTMVDLDDSEDTSFQLWRADSEDHLYEQTKEDFSNGSEEMERYFENEVWGYYWIPKFIGTIES